MLADAVRRWSSDRYCCVTPLGGDYLEKKLEMVFMPFLFTLAKLFCPLVVDGFDLVFPPASTLD